MPRKRYLFRDFVCPDGHTTHKFVEDHEDAVLCESVGCEYAALRPAMYEGLSASVIGDEIDYVDHNLGPEPIHIRSKAERRRLMALSDRVEFIRHTPVPGTDKSPFTTDWSKGSIDAQTLANARHLIERVYGIGVAPPSVPDADEVYDPVANPFVLTMDPANPDHREAMAKISTLVDTGEAVIVKPTREQLQEMFEDGSTSAR